MGQIVVLWLKRLDITVYPNGVAMPGAVVNETIENIYTLIARGEIQLGGRLPSERKLADMFCVSRSSVREALKELRQRGEIESRRGRRGGSFVATDDPFWQDSGRMDVFRESYLVVGRQAGQLWTLHDELPRQGRQLSTEILSARLERCTTELCARFGLMDSRSLYRIVRRRSSAGEPISYEQTYFDPARFKELLRQDLSGSLLLLALNHYHCNAAEVEEQVEVVAARGQTAEHLRVAAGASLLRVTMYIYDDANRVVLCSNDHYRPDHVRVSIRNRLRDQNNN
jgi:GntR family transcriptional regulator